MGAGIKRALGVVLALVCLLASPVVAQSVTAYVFWQEGCPHCTRAKATLAELDAEIDGLSINLIELGVEAANDALYGAVLDRLRIHNAGVPLVVVGGEHAIGYAGGGYSAGEYRMMINRCLSVPCVDIVRELRAGDAPPAEQGAVAVDTPGAGAGGTMTLPFLGEVELGSLSLPLLTLVLGGVDGFNPCAMWVLALLIGLLLGVKDARRMWTLGGVFLLATAAMYFAVMAAWLNVVLWLGAVGWIRFAIGALAIGAGVYYLREYWTNPEGVCRFTPGQRRKSISEAFQAMVEQPSLTVAAFGVAALAIAVNLVELACSAGLPAIYTQALAMHELPTAGYYGYLLAYIAVFLFDDTALFVIAMITLRAAVTTGRYARLSHLVGGVVLLTLGAIMVLRPELLG